MIAKRPAVLYLLPDRFHFFSPTLPSIIEFHYVPEFIRHQDIINQDLFENVLKLFIENGKIPPSSLLVIIADSACYIKDIVNLGVTQPQGQVPQQPQMDHAQMEKQAQEFIEYVPFDKVASKVIAIPGGMRVYAANLELLQSLRNVFEKEGSSIEMVLPALVFGTAVSNKPALDIQTANIFMQRMNEFRQQNMFEIIPMQVVKAVKRDSEPSMDADVPMLPQDNKPG